MAESGRPPLLLVSGEDDRTVEPGMVRQNLERYGVSPARTEFRTFPSRNHLLIGAPGWEEVADELLGWLDSMGKWGPRGATGREHRSASSPVGGHSAGGGLAFALV